MKKVVYHGGGFGKEYFWFSSDKDVAASYGDIRMIDRGYSGISDTILDDFKAYEINIQNPYIIDAKEEYYMDIPTPQEMLDDDFWHSETVDTDGICEYAKKKGHDSVIIKNVVEGHGIYNIADDYVCFNKSQFKELYNNKEKVEELKKELHNLIKTYGNNLKDDNQFIEDDIFELYLKNPVKLKYKEISKFTAYDDYFMLGKENYMYEPYVIDKYEDLETIINAVKKEVKQPAMKNSKKLKESLEKIDGCFITKSPYDIVNLLKNKPKEYRILYDKNIDMYMIGDAEQYIHHQFLEKAFKNGYYYSQEEFMKNMCGGYDTYSLYSYQDLGQSGYWDGEPDENFDAFLYYIVFSPNEEWTLGTDGYDKRYDYPFGHVFTRGCDLDEISLWEALGVPQETEKLNESEETILNDAFYKWFNGSKVVKNGKPLICYHGTNAEFDTFNSRYIGSGSGSAWFGYGFYFSTEKDGRLDDAANWYSDKIMEVYLSIKNPFIFTDDDEENLKNLAKVNGSISLKDVPISEVVKFLDEFELTFDESKIDVVDIGRQYDICLMYDDKTIAYQTRKADVPRYKTLIKGSMMYDKFGFSQIMLRDLYPSEITESLKKAGYDGIFMLPQIVAFYPNQIKSVNNRGTWSTISNNIYETLNKEIERYL